MKGSIILALMLLSLVFVSCAKKEKGPSGNASREEVVKWIESKMSTACDPSDSDKLCAEKLVRIGKLAIVPRALDLTADVFDEALKMDPSNKEALFYSTTLAPARVLKGIIGKMKNLYRDERHYAGLVKSVSKIKNLNVRDFLMGEDEKPWENFSEAQDYIYYDVIPALKTSRTALKELAKNDSFKSVFNYSEWTRKPRYGAFIDDAFQYLTNSKEYLVIIDKAEVMGIVAYLEYYLVQAYLTVAYNQDDYNDVNEDLLKAENNTHSDYIIFPDYPILRRVSISTKKYVRILKSYPMFLTLRYPQALHDLLDLTKEGLQNLEALARHFQSEDLELNVDKYTSNGLVWDYKTINNTQEATNALLPLLDGPTYVYAGWDCYSWKPLKILVDATELLVNPVQDLKDLLPNGFDHSGQGVNYPDLSFGGLFVNRDVMEAYHRTKRNLNFSTKKPKPNWNCFEFKTY